MAEERAAESIPLAALFGPPERDNPRLAPDGRRVAWLAAPEGIPDIWIADLPDGRPCRVTTAPPPGIHRYCWAPDGRHLLYVVDDAGDENWRLHAVDAADGSIRALSPPGAQADIIALSPHHLGHLLVALDTYRPGRFDAYCLDLAAGTRTRLAANRGSVERWFADPYHQVRVATERRPDGGLDVLHRAQPRGPWATVLHLDADDALASGPVAVPDTGILLVSTAGSDTSRLVHLDPTTGAITVLAHDPDGDVDDLLLDPRTHRPQAVAFAPDRRRWRALDPAVAADLAAVERLRSSGDMKIADRDRRDRQWLVTHTGPDTPGTHHLYDRATHTARHLFDQQPYLARHRLAPTRAFTCTARDGLAISGYWTPPVHGTAPHPSVLLVHGGPWWRDTWDWEPDVQWLTDRGYGCLRVNYRGSAGRGKAFLRAGHRQWGAAMQHDLYDALDHAVARGWTDPHRVVIMGSSYGGYAALVAATTAPARFRAAIAFAAPTNLVSFLRAVPDDPPSARRLWWTRVGNPDDPADAERLRHRSPLTHAGSLTIPVLIGHGANDPRVPHHEADQFVAVAQATGAPVEYHVYPGEGHGLAQPATAQHFHAAVDRFLARHL